MTDRAAPPTVPGLTGLTVLARGGYATVYRATQESIGREVAVKVENRTLESDRDRQRFMREARAAGRMSSHPHVVDLFDAGVTSDNHPYLIMELCNGTYAERMRSAPLSPEEAREVGYKIADALADGHSLGVLHRDVKPANILFSNFGEPALADFGLAILAEWRDMSITLDVLTPAYAPPEAFRQAHPTPAADVYALCATLYALMRGRPARWREDRTPSLASVVDMFNERLPDVPGVPAEMMDLLRAGMANDEASRPTAVELRDALQGMRFVAPSVVLIPPLGSPQVGVDPNEATVAHQAHAETVPQVRRASSGLDPDGAGLSEAAAADVPGSGLADSALSGVSGSGLSGAGGSASLAAAAAGPGSGGSVAVDAVGSASGGAGPAGAGSPTSTSGGSGPASGGAGSGDAPGGVPAQPGIVGSQVPSPPTLSPSRRFMWLALAATGCAVLAIIVVSVAYARGGGSPDHQVFKTPAAVSSQVTDVPTAGTQTAAPTTHAASPTATPGSPSATVPAGVGCGPLAPSGVTCPTNPDCYDSTKHRVACSGTHTWEAFAIGQLPAGVPPAKAGYDPSVLEACSRVTLLSVAPQTAGDVWQVDVLAPTGSSRTYRCLAGRGPNALVGSQLSRH